VTVEVGGEVFLVLWRVLVVVLGVEMRGIGGGCGFVMCGGLVVVAGCTDDIEVIGALNAVEETVFDSF